MKQIAEAAGASPAYDTTLSPPPVKGRSASLEFPACARLMGWDGECLVWLSISAGGRSENIMPVCTHAVFEAEATRLVGALEFEPTVIEGTPQPRYFIVQRVRFQLED
jgi:outer membrane biosynthesis protein TonB